MEVGNKTRKVHIEQLLSRERVILPQTEEYEEGKIKLDGTPLRQREVQREVFSDDSKNLPPEDSQSRNSEVLENVVAEV